MWSCTTSFTSWRKVDACEEDHKIDNIFSLKEEICEQRKLYIYSFFEGRDLWAEEALHPLIRWENARANRHSRPEERRDSFLGSDKERMSLDVCCKRHCNKYVCDFKIRKRSRQWQRGITCSRKMKNNIMVLWCY